MLFITKFPELKGCPSVKKAS